MFLDVKTAHEFLRRSRRANIGMEEFQAGNLEQECESLKNLTIFKNFFLNEKTPDRTLNRSKLFFANKKLLFSSSDHMYGYFSESLTKFGQIAILAQK